MATPATTPAAAPTPTPPFQAAVITANTHSTRPRDTTPPSITRAKVIITVPPSTSTPAVWAGVQGPLWLWVRTVMAWR